MSLKGSLSLSQKLQSGYINVAGAIVIKVVASQWVAFHVWVELAFLREQKGTGSVLHFG